MYEKTHEIRTIVTKKRVLNIGDTKFQVPYGTAHYRGYVYFKNDCTEEKEAFRAFEEICEKENILLGANVKYEFREYEDELYVEGDFLIFAYSEENVAEKLEQNGICVGCMNEISSCAFVTTERVVE